MKLINSWFNWLGIPKHTHDRAWHEEDQQSELNEFKEASDWFSRWSESSDVVFTNLRSRWDGVDLVFPLSRWRFMTGFLYGMYKYTSRALFYRRLGKQFGKDIRAIRNPRRTSKLHVLAEQYGIDANKLETEARKLMRYWPLLP